MIYISDKEQQRIKRKMLQKIGIIFFQTLGVILLSYGICMGRYLHPIEKHILNPNFEFLVSCFFYFAVSAAAPFSGGHLNPSVSLAFSRLRSKVDIKIYMSSQVIGGVIGAGVAYLFFGVVPLIYYEEVSFGSLVLDCLGECFGTFVFVFFILLIVETNYMSGEYFKYLIMAIMLLAGRTFTLRKGCVNPAIALAFQVFAAIDKKNLMLLVYSLILILGSLIGGVLASYFFRDFYAPLKEGIALKKMRESQLEASHKEEPLQ